MKIHEVINVHYFESNLYYILNGYGVIDYLAKNGNENVDIIEEIKEEIEKAYEAKSK